MWAYILVQLVILLETIIHTSWTSTVRGTTWSAFGTGIQVALAPSLELVRGPADPLTWHTFCSFTPVGHSTLIFLSTIFSPYFFTMPYYFRATHSPEVMGRKETAELPRRCSSVVPECRAEVHSARLEHLDTVFKGTNFQTVVQVVVWSDCTGTSLRSMWRP